MVAFSYNEVWRNPGTNKFCVISHMLSYPTTAIYEVLQYKGYILYKKPIAALIVTAGRRHSLYHIHTMNILMLYSSLLIICLNNYFDIIGSILNPLSES